jgi:hypothetical protein
MSLPPPPPNTSSTSAPTRAPPARASTPCGSTAAPANSPPRARRRDGQSVLPRALARPQPPLRRQRIQHHGRALRDRSATGRLTPLQAQDAGGKAPCHLVVDRTERTWSSPTTTPASSPPCRSRPTARSAHPAASSSTGPQRASQPGRNHRTSTPSPSRPTTASSSSATSGSTASSPTRSIPPRPPHARRRPLRRHRPRRRAASRRLQPRRPLCFRHQRNRQHARHVRYDPPPARSPVDTQSTLPPGAPATAPPPRCACTPTAASSTAPTAATTASRSSPSIPPPAGSTGGKCAVTGGRTPRNFALSPDGAWLVCGHQGAALLTAFRVDPATGRLTRSPPTAAVPACVCVAFHH